MTFTGFVNENMWHYTDILEMIEMLDYFNVLSCLKIGFSISFYHVKFSVLWVLDKVILDFLRQSFISKWETLIIVV